VKYYHGIKSKKNYFEGWFFKQTSPDLNIAFIPSIASTKESGKKCYIQVITPKFCHKYEFDYSKFKVTKKNLYIDIDNNHFSDLGINLDLFDGVHHIKAELTYGKFLKPRTNIMGFFGLWPFLECYHSLISMKHLVNGKVKIDDETYIFNNDIGYIESDFGKSFPYNYTWIQCNDFNKEASFFFSKATIPFLGFKFQGFICSLISKNKEYRFSTYNFSKIREFDKDYISIKKGKYKLKIYIRPKLSQKLLAPVKGNMNREVFECLDGVCDIVLFRKNIKQLIINGKNTGVEMSN
jgi:hypothetical protein